MDTTLTKGDGPTGRCSDIVVPEKYFVRITTGNQELDGIFGGDHPGVLPGSVVMVTGTPGAGKTTLMQQLADGLTVYGGRRLQFNLNEECAPMFKMLADRLGIVGHFAVSQRADIADLEREVLEAGVDVLVQDSVQTIACGQLRGDALLREVTRRLVRLAKDHDVTVFFTGHVTKSGQAAGPMALVHYVDMHAHLSLEKDGSRVLCLQKNRFGPAGSPNEFSLGAGGVSFKPTGPVKAEVSDREQRRAKTKNTIRELLLTGEMLSGYDYERLGIDCSGGHWRELLRQVVEELRREGHGMGEARVDGRMHSFVEHPLPYAAAQS